MQVQVLDLNLHCVNRILYTAARTCYSKNSPIDIFKEAEEKSNEDLEKLIMKALDAGHLSIAEHCNFTILIAGVSRALTHQLVRHRHCTFSQQSQRYCKIDQYNGFDYVVPDSIEQNKRLREGFNACMATLSNLYNVLVASGIKAEDARAILPNACSTNIVVTCNLRELMHICNERLCTCAQKEIRLLFSCIAKKVTEMIPWTYKYLVPKCSLLGYCNELPERSCGKKPLKEKVLDKNKNN